MLKFDRLLAKFGKWLRRICKGINCNDVIILFDGGTASQVEDYIFYMYLKENGYSVYADLNFYRKHSEDDMSVTARPLNFDQLINCNYKIAKPFKAKLYKKLFNLTLNGDFFEAVKKMTNLPVYLSGYPNIRAEEWQYYIDKYISLRSAREILDGVNFDLYERIKSQISVGVHVRRGDMAVLTEGCYWEVIPAQYFINITKIPELKGFKFFFFSEEPLWIEENIAPFIDVNFEICKNNLASNGYMDLFLLSNCNIQVKSQGSFGKIAYYLNAHKDKRAIIFDKSKPELWMWSQYP